MAIRPLSSYLDDPAALLIPPLVSVLSQTTANGAGTGLTLVDAALAGQPSMAGCEVIIIDGGAAGQSRGAVTHVAGTPTVIVDHPFTDPAGAVQQILAGTRYVIKPFPGTMLTGPVAVLDMLTRPRVSFYESWQDELGIDFTVWTVLNSATGVPWDRGFAGGYLRAAASCGANEVTRLVTTTRWLNSSPTFGVNTILRRLIVEFEMRLSNVVSMDNAICFFGLTPAQANDRISNNIAGFALLADVLQTVTDAGGVEETNTGFGENLALFNKFRIEIYGDIAPTIDFYLNEVLIARHTAQIPNIPSYLNFYVDSNAGLGASPEVGIVRIWYEDMVRP